MQALQERRKRLRRKNKTLKILSKIEEIEHHIKYLILSLERNPIPIDLLIKDYKTELKHLKTNLKKINKGAVCLK